MTRNVLIVDDNADAADTLATLLAILGHSVEVAYSGRDAIAIAMLRAPHVVFIDLAMPKINGFDLLRELRELPGMAKAKLVCLTGFGDEPHRTRATSAGCDAYLIKPAELGQVASVLEGSV